jgi:hypothetical protein
MKKNCDVSVFDVNNEAHEKREYVESNNQCEICDRYCTGTLCDHHRHLRREGAI